MNSENKKAPVETARSSSNKKSRFPIKAADQTAMGITLQGSGSKMTSTPAITTSHFPTFDASAITADSTYMPAIKQPLGTGARRKLPFKAINQGKVFNSSVMSRSAMPGKPKIKCAKDPDQLTEEELDILYCQYIQALYLESRSKKTLDLRAKDATEKLHKLWVVNQILMKKEKFIKRQLNSVMYLKQLLELCANQKEMLKLVIDTVPKMMDQVEDIANAVETIRHKLPAPMVSVPADADKEGELLQSAKQCEVLLQRFIDALPSEHVELDEVSGLLTQLVQLMLNVEKEIKRCTTLLHAADQLATEESSLKIGVIQLEESKS